MTALCIAGMACRFAGATSPAELWENVLAGRRAFRRIPAERLNLKDYFSEDRAAPDSIYSTEAAVIEGYEFDRVKYRVSAEAFESADLTHWLALDVAARALADAGYPDGAGLPRETTGVIAGNTLTGEFSRANLMRLRWPYVRRVLEADPAANGSELHEWLSRIEQAYKAPFPEVGEESLAGGLSNTLAGRIANHFDLKGGAYTVDGACAASLIAVTQAAAALTAGDLDVALVGGVDLSIDPFELVGFAKCGALASDEMRVFDARSNGFWPGEGCGFIVLMRQEDALAAGRRPYAVIRGWGVSSDGNGGLTRPTVPGQELALRRAYRRAEFPAGSVGYFEAHGTGTAVGDAVELAALAGARREAPGESQAAVVSSIKPNIGHTKAAAGIAGLIKAAMALHTQVLPGLAGCERPAAGLRDESAGLKALARAEPWPKNLPLRAGVSSMGFGGINAHVALEGAAVHRRQSLSQWEKRLISSVQDGELFLLQGDVKTQAENLAALAPRLSRAELSDLSVELARRAETSGPATQEARAALVASTPRELSERLATLLEWISLGIEERLDAADGVYLGLRERRLGFLFPGQGIAPGDSGGAVGNRFPAAAEYFSRLEAQAGAKANTAAWTQPAIVSAALAALRVLAEAGVEADVAAGHSLGELVALHWAGAFDEQSLLELAHARGEAMDRMAPAGAMLSLAANPREVEELLAGSAAVVAAFNAPARIVVSGPVEDVRRVAERAAGRRIGAAELPVSHAFHSPLMAHAAPVFRAALEHRTLAPLSRAVASTITGAPLDPAADLSELLYAQFTAPVRFVEAMTAASEQADVFIEVGIGEMLGALSRTFVHRPVFATAPGGPSLKPLLNALGAAFACGRAPRLGTLLRDRFARPLPADWRLQFFSNPCERVAAPRREPMEIPAGAVAGIEAAGPRRPALELVRQLVARRADLPESCVTPESRLLADLHLNSLLVSELVLEASRQLGLPPPLAPMEFADATVAAVAQALEEMKETGLEHVEQRGAPQGVDAWVRRFQVELVPARPHFSASTNGTGAWRILAPETYRWKKDLAARFRGIAGHGTILCLEPDPGEASIPLLLAAVESESRVIVVEHGGGGSAFAKTLFLESKNLTVTVVDTPYELAETVDWIAAEAGAAAPFSEIVYDSAGRRFEPVLRLCEEPSGDTVELGPADVLLVTGGGKGISAECALGLARATGVRLAILGRSSRADDAELAANLARMADAGAIVEYVRADVADALAVRAAIERAQAALGPITAVLHGAGANTPRLLTALTVEQFRATLAPKVAGLSNLLEALSGARLKLCVVFGSLIARTGMRGEGDYAVANEWLGMALKRWSAVHPECRCLTVEWSVWSGAGMGQRLGRVEALAHSGISAIPSDAGVRILRDLMERPPHTGSVVVSGRFGDAPTLRMDSVELPLLRFPGTPRIHYPGVEFVCDVELSGETDLYLGDHVFHGQRLFPAVMGLEAMAQVAATLAPGAALSAFENVRFLRPIAVPHGRSVTLRIAALTRSRDEIEIAIRTSETGFQADHFRATCRLDAPAPRAGQENFHETGARLKADLLYGSVLFQAGRFRRVERYLELQSKACTIEFSKPGGEEWYSGYLSEASVLGDAGARDAAIHAIQACIPHIAVLPVAVERIHFAGPLDRARFATARERSHQGNTFTYDVGILDESGAELERWTGLVLQVAAAAALPSPAPEALLAPYLERRAQDLLGADLRVRFSRGESRNGTASADIRRRPDGKPEAKNGDSISAAHSGAVKLMVRSAATAGCDLEPVRSRPAATWRGLLGADRFALAEQIAAGVPESFAAAATRVWTAKESMKKAGYSEDAPLLLGACDQDGWVLLSAGAASIATLVATIQDLEEPQAVALLAETAAPERALALASGASS